MTPTARRETVTAAGLLASPVRFLRLHRRGLAAALAGLAVLLAVRAVQGPAEPLTPVLVARHDLPAGAVVRAEDLTSHGFTPGAVPTGVVDGASTAIGRVLAAPLREGEPLTDVRLVAPGLLEGYPGLVAAPVRLADAAVAGLLRVGDPVDVVAADPESGEAEVLVADTRVLALPKAPSQATPDTGALVVLAVTPGQAVSLIGASVSRALSITLSR